MAARSEGSKDFILDEDGRRRLRKRLHDRLLPKEIVYFAESSNYKTKRYPDGQWVGYCTIRDPATGFSTRTVPKAFGDNPVAAVEHLEALREERRAEKAAAERPKTMEDLFEYCAADVWRRKAATTLRARRQRWRDYARGYWGAKPLSAVHAGEARTWFNDRAADGSVPYAQLLELKREMFTMGEHLGDLDHNLETRKNPFQNITLEEAPPRVRVTILRSYFAALEGVCMSLAEEGLATQYIVEMWLTSLYTGMRFGEVVALGRDQVDPQTRVLTVDRAMRVNFREVLPGSDQEMGEVKAWAIHLPKGGRPHPQRAVRRVRRVPISDHAWRVLGPVFERTDGDSPLHLLWPSSSGLPRERRLVLKAFDSLRERLHEVATLAPLVGEADWSPVPTRRGRLRNGVVDLARGDMRLRLPPIFGGISYRDSRNSFATYAKDVAIDSTDRDHILGHRPQGVGDTNYIEITDEALEACRQRLSSGWHLPSTGGEP